MSDEPEFYCSVCGNTIIKPAEPYPFEEDKGPVGECCNYPSNKMKSAEEWYQEATKINNTDFYTEQRQVDFIRAIQQDAIASRQVVDLEKLADGCVNQYFGNASNLPSNTNAIPEFLKQIILTALRKAQGGV